MRFWLRELAGWALVVLGLAIFGLAIRFLWYARMIEGPSVGVIGFIVFRGGIHLLKVAVAARVCLQAAEPVAGKPRPAARRG
jgi:hypothetical protein